MAPNHKSRRPAPNGHRAVERDVHAASPSIAVRGSVPLGGPRFAYRVPTALRATLNPHAAQSLRAARRSGVRATGSFPRILRLPRLRNVAPGCWPGREAQRLVPVSWFNDRWTPLVRVRRVRTRRLPRLRLQVTFKYPRSLTTL